MKFKHILLTGILFLSISCSLFKKAQAPKADLVAKNMTSTAETLFQNLYNGLSTSTDKTYTTHASDYDAPSLTIRELAVHDSARKHSDALMIIVHDAENRFHTYQSEHQNAPGGKLNNAQILAFREGMDALMDILVRTENHYK